ncbi:MAG: hypothetical protein KC621_04650 [Myxococcales bacterium]|nr:hypothetical protein [Myxococcales bacterium]
MWLVLLACGGTPTPAPAAPAPVVVEAPAPEVVPEPAPEPVAEPAPPARTQRRPPEGWVDLGEHVPGVDLRIRYATADNFVGSVLPGYAVPGAWMRLAPADALVRVQERLKEQGLGLRVYDAYRPLRGTLAMVAWAHRTDQVALLDGGYVARRSGHNRGNTIDLSAIRLSDGVELDMGVPWDTLSEAAHTRNATGEALANRMTLKAAMEAEGFKNYFREWWHYTFVEPGEKELAHRDVPYACAEPDEGVWKAPDGWREPGWVPPPPVDATPCEQ